MSENTDGLLRTWYLIAWDLGEAEDLIQETLLKVARQWPRVGRMQPRAWQLDRRCLTDAARCPRP